MGNKSTNIKYNSVKILMRRSEIEPVDMQLIHKNTKKFSNCCCSLPRRFPTVFSFKKNLHLKLKKKSKLCFLDTQVLKLTQSIRRTVKSGSGIH